MKRREFITLLAGAGPPGRLGESKTLHPPPAPHPWWG